MARPNRCPSLDSLFLNLLKSVKASGAAKIGHLKNLIRTSLAELSPGLRPISANLSRVFFFKFPQNRHQDDDFVGVLKKNTLSNLPNRIWKSDLSGYSRQARRPLTARLNRCPSLNSLFLNL